MSDLPTTDEEIQQAWLRQDYEGAVAGLVEQTHVLETLLRVQRAQMEGALRHAFVQEQRFAAERLALESAGRRLQDDLMESRSLVRRLAADRGCMEPDPLLDDLLDSLDWVKGNV